MGVTPRFGTTYTEDTFAISFLLGHKILKGGVLTIEIPPELTFTKSARCLGFSDLVGKSAKCLFDGAKLSLRDGFFDGPYD